MPPRALRRPQLLLLDLLQLLVPPSLALAVPILALPLVVRLVLQQQPSSPMRLSALLSC
jgi:hypothetical protein